MDGVPTTSDKGKSFMAKIPYGWVVVLTLSITELISWGAMYYSFGVLLTPMHVELGWSRAELSAGFSIGLLVAGLAAIPLGRWVDLHGPRLLMTSGSILGVAMLLAWSQVQHLVAFYAAWAGIGLACAATLYEPAFATLASWFRSNPKERTRALAVLTFFGGLASLAFIPLAEYLVRSFGWREALIWLAAIVAVGTILPHAVLLRRASTTEERQQHQVVATQGQLVQSPSLPAVSTMPQPTAPSVDLRTALRSPVFWWLALAFSLNTLIVVTLNVHLVSYLIESGNSSSLAALAAGAHGLFSVTGRLTLAPLSSRIQSGRLLACLFLLQVAALIALLFPSITGIAMYVVLFGIGSGAATPVRAALIAERYGHANYGRINGTLTTVAIWARVAAPIGAGLLAALVGYRPLLVGLAIAALAAVAAVFYASREGSV
jgi:MFS family permease